MSRWLLLLLWSISTTSFELSDKFTGWYSGEPTTAPIGPMGGVPIIWSIQPVDQARGIWLMEDMYLDGMIIGSHQQFLVTPTTVTYCGLLRNFVSTDASKPAAVLNDYIYQSDKSNNSQTVWCAHDQAGGCGTFQWTVTIIAFNATKVNSFRIEVLFPPAVHVDVIFTLRGGNPSAGYPHGIDYTDRKICQLINSQRYMYAWNTAEYPHYDSYGKSVPPPEIAAITKKLTKPTGTVDLVRNQPRSGRQSPYSFCYVINNQTQFKLEWSIENLTGIVSMRISAKTSGWVAIGFYPLFPGMEHAKIILGSESCGVSAMEATAWVGTPVKSNWTTVSDTAVSSSEGVLSINMKFKKPPEPQWRSNHEVMFAVGNNGENCDDPAYHGNLRGMVGIQDLSRPDKSLSPYLMCN
eukprot:TRINITY_DN27595_c0_g1_i1.p1 TRINITY_DN27595_c0_g1~~TRINITY_DN27595_c0_g1_i1.p1  ORF type:complete len:408 (+),score=48.89 TRINITY_DN27595_c0_g1_i1:62-1285(+)